MCTPSPPLPSTHTHTHTAGIYHRVHDVWLSDAVPKESQTNKEDSQWKGTHKTIMYSLYLSLSFYLLYLAGVFSAYIHTVISHLDPAQWRGSGDFWQDFSWASSKVLSYHHGNWLFLPLILRLMEGPGAHYSQLMRTGMMATNCVTSFFSHILLAAFPVYAKKNLYRELRNRHSEKE